MNASTYGNACLSYHSLDVQQSHDARSRIQYLKQLGGQQGRAGTDGVEVQMHSSRAEVRYVLCGV
eukprot:47591-Eustigmatos_ZCMA.PRE.1